MLNPSDLCPQMRGLYNDIIQSVSVCACACACMCVHVHALVYVYMYANGSECCVFVLRHAVWVFGSRKYAAFVSLCSDRCKSGKLLFLCVQTAASLASFCFFVFRPLQVLISLCSDRCKSGKLLFLCVQTAASLATSATPVSRCAWTSQVEQWTAARKITTSSPVLQVNVPVGVIQRNLVLQQKLAD